MGAWHGVRASRHDDLAPHAIHEWTHGRSTMRRLAKVVSLSSKAHASETSASTTKASASLRLTQGSHQAAPTRTCSPRAHSHQADLQKQRCLEVASEHTCEDAVGDRPAAVWMQESGDPGKFLPLAGRGTCKTVCELRHCGHRAEAYVPPTISRLTSTRPSACYAWRAFENRPHTHPSTHTRVITLACSSIAFS